MRRRLIQECMSTPPPPDWNHIRAFFATAKTGSFSAAAKQLGLTQPTLSRQVSALEGTLGVLLFERIGRELELTSAGRELLTHSHKMGIAADGFARTAKGQAQDIEGLVRITASDVVSAYVLPKALRLLQNRAPRQVVEVIADNAIRDIMRREADIAIRHVRPEQPDLIARKLRETRGHLYAASSYLRARGRPASVADTRLHDFLYFGDISRMIGFLRDIGVETTEQNYRLGSENGVVAWDLVRQGFGIAVMMEEIGDATPGVERLFPEMEAIEFPIWLTTHRELHTSRKIRLVFDVLAEALST